MGVAKLADYLRYFSSKRVVVYWAVGPETGEVSIGARSADLTGTLASLHRLCFYHALLTPSVLWTSQLLLSFCDIDVAEAISCTWDENLQHDKSKSEFHVVSCSTAPVTPFTPHAPLFPWIFLTRPRAGAATDSQSAG